MINQTFYSCFSEQGEDVLPTGKVLSSLKDEVEPIVFLDSCICLEIIKVVDYKKQAKNVNFAKIIALKEYASKHQIEISPFFGLLELCLKDGKLDEDKLWDFHHRIDFFKKISLKIFKTFKYDFAQNYIFFRPDTGWLVNPYKAIEPTLRNSYCALLKIRCLAKKGLTREMAEKNISVFLEWMKTDLDIVRAVEYKLALNIFGGNSVYRKMIGLDCKPNEVIKRLVGTTWDIFHSNTTSNSFRLFKMLDRNFLPYFLTSDANLFNIFKNFKLCVIKDGGDVYTSSFLRNSDFLVPHFAPDFIDRQNEKMMDCFIERGVNNYKYDKQKVDDLIRKLEIENDIQI
ncbi:MAG: hypothetical protein V4649_19945 [Bacteroidota bacterium]